MIKDFMKKSTKKKAAGIFTVFAGIMLTSTVLLGDWNGNNAPTYTTGNVGIGTADPEAKLHVEGKSIFHFDDWGNDVMVFRGQKSGAPNYYGEYAIRPTYFGLFFRNTQTNKEMLTIYNNGNLNVPGEINTGSLKANATITATNYACSSDGRYKKDINVITNPLTKLLTLKGITYNWDTSKFKQFTDKRDMGFIAQDVEKVFPEIVYTDQKGYKSVAYDKITAVIVEALKEMKKGTDAKIKASDEKIKLGEAKISSLEKENASLKVKLAKLDSLNERLAKMERIIGMNKLARN